MRTRMCLVLVAAAMACGADQKTAVIRDSGSTNRAGYNITVEETGAAMYVSQPRPAQAARGAQAVEKRISIPSKLAQSLFADLSAAGPLSSLPVVHCAKSASFGSVLTIEYGGEHTPDLSCPDGGDARLKALINDAREITALAMAK